MIRPDLRKEHVGYTFIDLKLYVVVSDPVHVGHTLSTIVKNVAARNIHNFKKPRLSQIVQIQSNLQKSIALKLQTSCSFIKKKQNVNSFSFETKIFRIEVAQPIFFTCS